MAKYTIIFIINFVEPDRNDSIQSSRLTLDKTPNKKKHPNGMFVLNIKDMVKQYVHIKCKNFTQQISNIYITYSGKVAKVRFKFKTSKRNYRWLSYTGMATICTYVFIFSTIRKI